MPDAKPRDSKHTVGIISIWYLNKEHFLNAYSKVYSISPVNNAHFYPEKYSKIIKCRNYELLVWITDISDLRDSLNIPKEVRDV